MQVGSSAAPEAPESVHAQRLAGCVRGDVLSDSLSRAMYSTDASIYQIPPAVVVCPRDEADVRAAVAYAARAGLAIVARGR